MLSVFRFRPLSTSRTLENPPEKHNGEITDKKSWLVIELSEGQLFIGQKFKIETVKPQSLNFQFRACNKFLGQQS